MNFFDLLLPQVAEIRQLEVQILSFERLLLIASSISLVSTVEN